MKLRGHIVEALVLACLLPAALVAQDSGTFDNMGDCKDGSPRMYFVVDALTDGDCSADGGTGESQCCCLAGVWDSCATTISDFAPYGLNDPLKPPASAGTGGCIETFISGAEVCSWSWANQDSASISYDQGSALLLGDATNELHVRAIAAATNADQTFTVRLNTWWDGTSADNDMCGIVVTEGGTLAAPTSIRYSMQGDLATNGLYWMSDTDYAPTGATTLQSISWDLTMLRGIYVCHQLRYIDSTRAVGFWYSVGTECTDWAQLGSVSTLSSDPLYWGFHVRQGGPCRVQRAQLRTDTDKNTWGTP